MRRRLQVRSRHSAMSVAVAHKRNDLARHTDTVKMKLWDLAQNKLALTSTMHTTHTRTHTYKYTHPFCRFLRKRLLYRLIPLFAISARSAKASVFSVTLWCTYYVQWWRSDRAVVKALCFNIEDHGFDPVILRCEEPSHAWETINTRSLTLTNNSLRPGAQDLCSHKRQTNHVHTYYDDQNANWSVKPQ